VVKFWLKLRTECAIRVPAYEEKFTIVSDVFGCFFDDGWWIFD
jgi:hypothetical protein